MGEVIDFPTGKKKEMKVNVELDVDPQTLLEHAIVMLWAKLGGFGLKLEAYTYHMCFMAFCDMCFSNMEIERFSVDDKSFAIVDKLLIKEMKDYINDIRSKEIDPKNDK